MHMTDEGKPLKISDFRMFNPDGSWHRSGRGPGRRRPAAAPAEPEADADVDEELVDMVNSLATSALAAMGLLAEPGHLDPDRLVRDQHVRAVLARAEHDP